METEELMSSIEHIAQDNLAKQQMLDDLKTQVLDRISRIVQLKMNYEELNKLVGLFLTLECFTSVLLVAVGIYIFTF